MLEGCCPSLDAKLCEQYIKTYELAAFSDAQFNYQKYREFMVRVALSVHFNILSHCTNYPQYCNHWAWPNTTITPTSWCYLEVFSSS